MVGKTLGHYRFLEPLDAGGGGEVYLAQRRELGRVACRVATFFAACGLLVLAPASPLAHQLDDPVRGQEPRGRARDPVTLVSSEAAIGQEPQTAFGFRVGEERRYVLGPPGTLPPTVESMEWGIRLHSIRDDPPPRLIIFVIEFVMRREVGVPFLEETEATGGRAELIVNEFGFPHRITFVEWEPAARERMKRIPAFVRGMVTRAVESHCAKNGISVVTESELEKIRSRMPTPKVFGR